MDVGWSDLKSGWRKVEVWGGSSIFDNMAVAAPIYCRKERTCRGSLQFVKYSKLVVFKINGLGEGNGCLVDTARLELRRKRRIATFQRLFRSGRRSIRDVALFFAEEEGERIHPFQHWVAYSGGAHSAFMNSNSP